jgi:hypothetical protein
LAFRATGAFYRWELANVDQEVFVRVHLRLSFCYVGTSFADQLGDQWQF